MRVHVAELAHRLGLKRCGLVGDYMYLPPHQVAEDRSRCQRVFLHARVLEFQPPGLRHPVRIECEWPAELRVALRKLSLDEVATHQLQQVTAKRRRRKGGRPEDWHSECLLLMAIVLVFSAAEQIIP